MGWQDWAVAAVVLWAAGYVGRSMWSTLVPAGGCGGCSAGCGSTAAASEPAVLSIGPLRGA